MCRIFALGVQMPIKVLIISILFSTSLFCNLAVSNDINVPEDWVESCPNNDFCFIHPKSLMRIPVQVIDSNTGKFQSEEMILSFDLGWYSTQFSELTKATQELVIIDGREGKVLLQDDKMALSIPKIKGKIRFSMLLTFSNKVSLEQGKRIFSSLRFQL
jgi:hypothetical protein